MEFRLDETVPNERGRLGLLTLTKKNGTLKKLPTPSCLIYTSTCSVPHLTPDNVSSLSLSTPNLPICIATESLIPLLTPPPSPSSKVKDHRVKKQALSSDPCLAFKTTYHGGVHEYICQSPDSIIVTELRDLNGWLFNGTQEPGNADGVLTTTLPGYTSYRFLGL